MKITRYRFMTSHEDNYDSDISELFKTREELEEEMKNSVKAIIKDFTEKEVDLTVLPDERTKIEGPEGVCYVIVRFIEFGANLLETPYFAEVYGGENMDGPRITWLPIREEIELSEDEIRQAYLEQDEKYSNQNVEMRIPQIKEVIREDYPAGAYLSDDDVESIARETAEEGYRCVNKYGNDPEYIFGDGLNEQIEEAAYALGIALA